MQVRRGGGVRGEGALLVASWLTVLHGVCPAASPVTSRCMRPQTFGGHHRPALAAVGWHVSGARGRCCSSAPSYLPCLQCWRQTPTSWLW